MVGMLLVASGQARTPDHELRRTQHAAHEAVMDSLSEVHPRLRGRWLNERGLEMPGINAPLSLTPDSDSGGLRLVGKFGRGPSVEVTGRDSLVFLSLGSQVAIINFADPGNPEVLSEPQAMGLVTQAAVRDSFLYIGCMTGQAGIEVWNIADPRNPVLRSRTPTLLSDFCIRDTFLYLTQLLSGPNDTFKIYSIADPENVYLLGACPDSGDAVTVTNNTAFLADRWGLYALDVSDPRNPRRVGSYPGVPISVEARGNILCVSFMAPNRPDWLQFEVLDVSVPAAPRRLGFLSDAGGYDCYLADTLAFLSGYYTGGHEFRVLNIADSTRPSVVGTCSTAGNNFGVWADPRRSVALVADHSRGGMAVIDIRHPTQPVADTMVLVASNASDIAVVGDYALVANWLAGLKVLDISDPAGPYEVAGLDSLGDSPATEAVAWRDSFAFADWSPPPRLRTISMADPGNPAVVGGCPEHEGGPKAIVLRDTLVYTAGRYRFQVVNVADPRNPVRVGVLVHTGVPSDLVLSETLAIASRLIVNIADPTTPKALGTFPVGGNGCAIRDTLAFYPATYDSFLVYSIADPMQPRRVSSIRFSEGHVWNSGVQMLDSLVYIGGDFIHVVDIRDPTSPREVGSWLPPYKVGRLRYHAPYLYATCLMAGVSILEPLQIGVTEPSRTVVGKVGSIIRPTPCRDYTRLEFAGPSRVTGTWRVVDATGRTTLNGAFCSGMKRVRIRMDGQAPGVYFLEVTAPQGRVVHKFVKE
jgi:hypothetical protein